MSSRRRSRELHSRSGAGSSKLRMDSRPQQPRITDPSNPAGRKREIDTVMKKARSSPHSNGYWDKKLLEVEAKDPNRWRHSGYKQLYIGGSSSPSPPRQRRRSRSRSRSYRRSAGSVRQSRRSPRGRSPARRGSPPRRSRTPSQSSVSSCSDDSCSVCSPKRTRDRRMRSRSRSYSVPRSRPNKSRGTKAPQPGVKSRMVGGGRPRPAPTPPSTAVGVSTASGGGLRRGATAQKTGGRPADPRRAMPHSSRVRNEIVELSPSPPPPPSRANNQPRDKIKKKKDRKEKEKAPIVRVKTERQKKRRPASPTVAESSGSEDSSSSSLSAVVASTRLTLSERFGKMAQWSVDRRDIENMRITKNNTGDLKVMIEQEERLYDSPPLRYSHSPAPIGHFPDELMSSGPSGLAAWDDVRVRYQYYKDLGYLRDLTLEDYIKWEQWWYKYQEWLKNERYYEHWLQTQNRRRRKPRIPATQRLN